MTPHLEMYLGDGLYARDDGMQIWLRAPREGGDSYVAIDGEVLEALLRFIERSRSVKITVTKEPS